MKMDQITQVGINPTHLTFLPKGPDSVNTFTLVQSIHSFYFLLLIKKKKDKICSLVARIDHTTNLHIPGDDQYRTKCE